MELTIAAYTPGIYKINDEITVEELANLCGKQGWQYFYINGEKVNNKEKFLLTAAQEMLFPDYFGDNWDALYDCMTDLDAGSSKGYVLLYSDPENFAENDAANWSTSMEVLQSVVKFWQQTDTPMYVLMKSCSSYVEGLPSI